MYFNGRSIKSNDWVYVFGKIRIGDIDSFTIQFVNIKSIVSIGIVDETYKKLSNLGDNKNIIRYWNTFALYDGG